MKLIGIGANNPETLRMIKAIKGSHGNFEFIGFIDNDEEKKGNDFCGLPIFGGIDCIDQHIKDDVKFINLITRDCATRYETSVEAAKKGVRFANFIHPSVNLDMVSLGLGNYIQEGVILQAGVVIGNNSSIHMASLIGHETKIGHSTFIAHGCNLSGLVNVEDGVFIGTGACLLPRITIGAWSTIGAGAVVRKDVPPYSIVVGNPAKFLKENDKKHTSGNPL